MGVAQRALEYRAAQEKTLGHTHDGCKHAQAKKLGAWVGVGVRAWVGRWVQGRESRKQRTTFGTPTTQGTWPP